MFSTASINFSWTRRSPSPQNDFSSSMNFQKFLKNLTVSWFIIFRWIIFTYPWSMSHGIFWALVPPGSDPGHCSPPHPLAYGTAPFAKQPPQNHPKSRYPCSPVFQFCHLFSTKLNSIFEFQQHIISLWFFSPRQQAANVRWGWWFIQITSR